jgi:hypothetical protein
LLIQLSTASEDGCSTGTAKRPEPLCTQQGVTSLCRGVWHHVGRRYPAFTARADSCASPKPSYASVLPLRIRSLQVTVSPCWVKDPSRPYFCDSFSACLDPYPDCFCGALARYFPTELRPSRKIEPVGVWQNPHCSNFSMGLITGLQSFSYVQGRRFAFHPDCSYRSVINTGQPWLLHPSISRLATLSRPRYANRPIRATDGERTHTSQESQPCRLLPIPRPISSLSTLKAAYYHPASKDSLPGGWPTFRGGISTRLTIRPCPAAHLSLPPINAEDPGGGEDGPYFVAGAIKKT